MPAGRRRSPRRRLVVTLAALASLILGYYLGQAWQRGHLQQLSAIVYPAGVAVSYPSGLGLPDGFDGATAWRLFTAVDLSQPACVSRVRESAFILNRLAAWPDIQARLRLSLLTYGQAPAASAQSAVAGPDWIEWIDGENGVLDTLTRQLGIMPLTSAWCAKQAGGLALVSPAHEQWALIPWEDAASMAHNIATVIEFLE